METAGTMTGEGATRWVGRAGIGAVSLIAAIVIALKILWDLWLHLRERRSFAESAKERAAD